MGIFRTIFGKFWRIKKYPKICKPRFFLSIRHLVSGLKTRVFRTERGVGGFQASFASALVKIFSRFNGPGKHMEEGVTSPYYKCACSCSVPMADS